MDQRNWVHMLMSDHELRSLEDNLQQALRLARELDDELQIATALQGLEDVARERRLRTADVDVPF